MRIKENRANEMKNVTLTDFSKALLSSSPFALRNIGKNTSEKTIKNAEALTKLNAAE